MCDLGGELVYQVGGCDAPDGGSESVAERRRSKRFYLDGPFVGVYLTFREAQCLHYYLLGLTLTDVAVRLGLSHRTVEYYIANVKKKLRVRSKLDLFHQVRLTRFRFTRDV